MLCVAGWQKRLLPSFPSRQQSLLLFETGGGRVPPHGRLRFGPGDGLPQDLPPDEDVPVSFPFQFFGLFDSSAHNAALDLSRVSSRARMRC